MGQSQSLFIYSPLKFVDFTKTLGPEIQNKLEAFLVRTLYEKYNIAMNDKWKEIVRVMCHKIKCVSEGWEVLPTIHFFITEKGVVCVKKITESV
jgi:hypothetical protein